MRKNKLKTNNSKRTHARTHARAHTHIYPLTQTRTVTSDKTDLSSRQGGRLMTNKNATVDYNQNLVMSLRGARRQDRQLYSDSECAGSRSLRNVGTLHHYTASLSRRPQLESSPPWKL